LGGRLDVVRRGVLWSVGRRLGGRNWSFSGKAPGRPGRPGLLCSTRLISNSHKTSLHPPISLTSLHYRQPNTSPPPNFSITILSALRLSPTSATMRRSLASATRSLATAASQQPPSLPLKVTTLPNGIRVATDPTPGHFVAAGVYVDAGSRYEGDRTRGAGHMVDRLGFKVSRAQPGGSMTDRMGSPGLMGWREPAEHDEPDGGSDDCRD